MQYAIPKGVFDILPRPASADDLWRASDLWAHVESVIRQVAQAYNFKEIRTPIFERTELFTRGIGEHTDIVSKEMYTFLDKGERSMSLRPEGTAPAMRAFIENNLVTQGPLHKLFYIGPMFRYERPQSGRYRQHHQFGVEAIGISRAEQDVEVIDLLCELYRRLGLKDLTVMVNSVGDAASRAPYMQALQHYLQDHYENLSAESKARFSKNLLRILDSKDPQDQAILERAPSILDMLGEESKLHFEEVKKGLKQIGIPYLINPKLVRGLDYYNKTVFEVLSGQLGAQNSVGGGGRYDGLMASMGGPNLPAVGFGTGIERILHTMLKQQVPLPAPSHPLLFLVAIGEAAFEFCFTLLGHLRKAGISSDMDLSGKKMQHGLQLANTLGAEYSLVIGDKELESRTAPLKNMKNRESQDVSLSDLTLKFLEIIDKQIKL